MSAAVAATIAACRAALAPRRRAGERIGFVPTMGALHEGHLALVDRARARADVVVVSVFVNPIQFDSADDLARYPRDLDRDVALVGARGADLVFAPTPDEMFPRPLRTRVTMAGITDGLEGAFRPGHFDGVLTIVTKLFHVVQPDVAVFGAKDAQQAAAVRRLVADLDVPVEIDVVPTVRDPDGLAASSRNVRLDPAARVRALAIPRALERARALATAGEDDPRVLEAAMRAALAADGEGLDLDYAAVVDADEFTPVDRIDRPAVAAVAARVGGVRLIDAVPIEAP